MYQLLMRAFPGWYEYNSVYAMYPFTIPRENRNILTSLNLLSSYSLNPPKKPAPLTSFSTAKSAREILGNDKAFKSVWGKAISSLTGNWNFMLSGDTPVNHADREVMMTAIYKDAPTGMDEIWDFYMKQTTQLLRERSYPLGNYFQVDAVREYPSNDWANIV